MGDSSWSQFLVQGGTEDFVMSLHPNFTLCNMVIISNVKNFMCFRFLKWQVLWKAPTGQSNLRLPKIAIHMSRVLTATFAHH